MPLEGIQSEAILRANGAYLVRLHMLRTSGDTSASFSELSVPFRVAPGRKRRGLAERPAMIVDQLPNNCLLYPKAAARFRYPHTAIAVDESIGGDSVQQSLPLRSIRFRCRQARRKRDELFPAVTKAGLRSTVSIDESRIWLCVVGKHDKWSIVIQPLRTFSLRNERRSDNTIKALRNQGEEFLIRPEIAII
jgi:hypothetical protein